jgi:AcrR family transcriptional regulator
LHHAAVVFAECGFEGASMRDLSRASGVSLSGLYYYAESKQKLLYLIQYTAISKVLENLNERLTGMETPEERLGKFVQNHVQYFLAHPAEMKVLSHEEEALEEPYRREVAALKRRYYHMGRDIFSELAAAPSLNPRVAVLSLYGMMNWICKWHNFRIDPGAEELARAISEIFLRGVLYGFPDKKETLPALSLQREAAVG